MRIRSRLLVVLSAVVMAGWGAGLTGCDQNSDTTAADPRSQGLMPHELPDVDPNILNAQKGSTVAARPTPPTPVRPTPAPGTGTAAATTPESAPGTAATAVAADTTAYPIKFTRPYTVGSSLSHRISVENSQTTTTTPTGGTAQKVETIVKGELAGTLTVSSIDTQGDPKDFTFAVDSFTGGDGKTLIPAGKVIDVKRTEKDVMFSIAGETLSAQAKDVLKAMFDPLSSSTVDDDEAFGSSSPHKVGESWPINKEVVAKQLNESGMAVDVKNVADQSVYLRRTVDNSGGKSLLLEAFVNAKDFKTSDLPPQATVESSTLEAQLNGIFPVDATQLPREVGHGLRINMHLVLPNAAIELTINSSRRIIISPQGTEHAPAATAPAPAAPATTPVAPASGPAAK